MRLQPSAIALTRHFGPGGVRGVDRDGDVEIRRGQRTSRAVPCDSERSGDTYGELDGEPWAVFDDTATPTDGVWHLARCTRHGGIRRASAESPFLILIFVTLMIMYKL